MNKLLVLVLLVTGMIIPCKTSNAVPERASTEEVVNLNLMSIEERIDYSLSQYGIDSVMRKLIIAQAKHESGNFKSKLFKKHNNLFGMMHPRVRPTLSKGSLARAEGRPGYASFETIENSVQDYILWMKFNSLPTTFKSPKEYAKTLKEKRYFTDDLSRYTKGLERHLQ